MKEGWFTQHPTKGTPCEVVAAECYAELERENVALRAEKERLDKLDRLLWNGDQDCVILFPTMHAKTGARAVDIEASDDPCTGENICRGTTLREAIDSLPNP